MWIVWIFTILCVISDAAPQSNEPHYNVVTVKRIKFSSKNSENVTLQYNRHQRCRRYARQYYGAQRYSSNIEFNQQFPVYYPGGYYVRPYVPPKCYTYCQECPTSSCRRRCSLVPNAPSPSQACNCNPNGSKYSSCDPITGNCVCKPHYEGRTCDVCKVGYWKTLKTDCIKCHCNDAGSIDSTCDQETGQCNCKPGVEGQNCDRCRPSYYGTVDVGCVECEPCTKKGHSCGEGGKCVCPPLTIGRECERCAPNSWGFEQDRGCRACNCSLSGSVSGQCNKNSGFCSCKPGFTGSRCDRCSFGYYGYPNCKLCACDSRGTLETDCQNGVCQCNEDGSCNCKEHVRGLKCATCTEETFGLSKEDPRGCTRCFCFGRSKQCTDTGYNWDKIRFEKSENGILNNEPIGFDVLSLPKQFTGSLITSYDGYLSVNGSGGGRFHVFLVGNGISLVSDTSTNELRMNERHWRVSSGDVLSGCHSKLSRECFLLALQKVTSIVVNGQDMEIVEVLLDVARADVPFHRSHSIEKCVCPPEYTGLSCQDPNRGYYRYFPNEHELTPNPWIDRVLGVARACECNGRSAECDPDTGHCKNCSRNTWGAHCEQCAPGFYQDPFGSCRPCLCPSESNNNAESCVVKKHGFICNCRTGYTGPKCERCKDTYFQDPATGKCVPCKCNYYGSYSDSCESGICDCKPGFQGDTCNQCVNPRQYIKDGICTDCDECTQLLFDDIDKMDRSLEIAADLMKDGLQPPWKTLEARKSKYRALNTTFHNNHDRANKLLRENDIDQLEARAYSIKRRVHELNKTAEEQMETVEGQRDKAAEFLRELKHLEKKLVSITEGLKEFGMKHVDVEATVAKARSILERLKEDFKRRIKDVEDHNRPIIEFCNEVSQQANAFCRPPPELPYEALNALNEKLDEFKLLVEEVERRADEVKKLDDDNIKGIERLKEKIKTINRLKKEVNETEVFVLKVNRSLEDLESLNDDMKNFDYSDFNRLESIFKDTEEEMVELDDRVQKAIDHAHTLRKRVDGNTALLRFNDEDTKKIKTTGAYNDILEGIAKANETTAEAENVLSQALEWMNPSGRDKLIDEANILHGGSDRQKHRIESMKDLQEKFSETKNKVEKFRGDLIDNARFNNELNQKLQNLEVELQSKENLANRLHESIDSNSKIIDRMRELRSNISDMNSKLDYYRKSKGDLSTTRLEAEKEIKNAKSAGAKLSQIRKKLIENGTFHEDLDGTEGQSKLEKITSNIKKLQNQVKLARQNAETINFAMSLADCTRSYSFPESNAFRDLAILFKCSECQLFDWTSAGLTVNVNNASATLRYTGNGEDLMMVASSARPADVERLLYVQWSGCLLRMRLDDGPWTERFVCKKALMMTSRDLFQVGGGKPNNSYILRVSINDNNVGLWSFDQSSRNCSGRFRVENGKIEPEGRKFFSGTGYVKFWDKVLSPKQFVLDFPLSTFDENSLLYLAKDATEPCAYLAVSLEDGRPRFYIRHNNDQTMLLKAKNKVNDGSNHTVTISMLYDKAEMRQSYKLDSDGESILDGQKLPSDALFKIKKSDHYWGGVPPSLDPACAILANTTSFLGYMKKEINNISTSSGVTDQKVGELELHKAWFIGNGFLRLSASHDPIKLGNVSFVLRPLNPNAAIMDFENFGTITLSNQSLQINLKNGEHYLVQEPLRLNEHHFVGVQFKAKRIVLTVDKKDLSFTRMNKSNDALKTNSLIVVLGRVEGFEPFYGGISDIVVNGRSVPFNSTTVLDFNNVEMGRTAPFLIKAPPENSTIVLKRLLSPTTQVHMANTMQNTQGCATTSNYVTDPTAVALGDAPDSFVKVNMPFGSKDFRFSFEFRTLYPEGMLFVSAGSSSSYYHLLELSDGKITFHAKKRKKNQKNWPISFSKRVDDGQWHTVKISRKNGKRPKMRLDDEVKQLVKIPKKAGRIETFFGSFPRDYFARRDMQNIVRPFRGCINHLKINEEEKLLAKNTNDVTYSNIRQCFLKVETGTYFGGDAYAVYRSNFRINKILELAFQFRTAEPNGILLTVSNKDNYPALSVELQNGAVVMTVDLGNGVQSNVTNNLDSDTALCNNMWHNVTAIYSSSELTVRVDGISKVWVQSDVNSLMDEIDAPLYIGGLPDDAAVGTLKTRENFKGCLRNLKIDGALQDWADMEELNNTLLNSCPSLLSSPKK